MFNTIIEMSVKAAIVIAFILVIRLFLRNTPKKFSYLLWSVAAFRLCIPYSFKSIVSIFNIGSKTTVGEQINNTINRIPAGRPVGNVNVGGNFIVDSPAVNAPNTGIDGVINTNPITESASFDLGALLMQVALILWIIGVAAMVLWGVISYIKTYRRMQNAILYRDNIYFSDRISSPFSMGFIKPKIYLPFGLSDEEQECIIQHEKCHVKRFDHIVKLFAYLLLCVHWFNPMCWVAFDRMGYDMEMSCDEMVFRK